MLLEHNKSPCYDRSRAASYIWLRIESNLLYMHTAWDQTYWFSRRYTSIASMFRRPLSVLTRLEAIAMSPFGSKLEVSLRTKGLLVDRRDAWACNELLYVAWSSLCLTPQRASLNAVLLNYILLEYVMTHLKNDMYKMSKVLGNAVSNTYLYFTDSKLYNIGFTVEEK